MASIVERTTSARRVMGGTGFTVEPTVCVAGSACASQLAMVFEQMRKTWATRLWFQPSRLLISRMRKRCDGV